MHKIKYYTSVYRAFVRNTFAREADYRGNLIAEIIDSLLNFIVNITFFGILYFNVDYIAGWNNAEMLSLIGVTQLITSILYILFMNNLPRIQRYILSGDFDYILLKPCDEQFYVSFRYFYFGGLPNLVFSVGLIIYAVLKLEVDIRIVNVLVFLIYIISGVIICYAIWLIIMTLSIMTLKVGQLHELFLSSLKFMEYPKGIYKGMIRAVVLYIVPLVTVSNIPVEVLLGKLKISNSFYIIILAVMLYCVSRFFWKISLCKYNSASS